MGVTIFSKLFQLYPRGSLEMVESLLISSIAGSITLADLENQGILSTLEFAQNPNPINYGLTGGDIVFAIIGSILCTVVMGLVILGFCIHPFLLS